MSFYHIRAKECAEYTTTIYCVAVQKNQQKQSTQSLIPFPFFRQYFFQQQTSKPTRILFKSSKTLHWFLCVYFSTFKQALCNWYTAQIRTYKVLKT